MQLKTLVQDYSLDKGKDGEDDLNLNLIENPTKPILNLDCMTVCLKVRY
jgi:hypothetical protein